MEWANKKIWLLVGVFAVLAAGLFLSEKGITGSTIGRHCSGLPEITSIKMVGRSLSMNWEDTSTFEGGIRYEALLFEKKEDGTYDFNEPLKSYTSNEPYITFERLGFGTYVAKLRARNDPSCLDKYTDYVTSEEITYKL